MVAVAIQASGGDYTTYGAAEADLDDSGVFTASQPADLEGAAEDFTENSVLVNGGGTLGVSSIKISAQSGAEFDGTGGSGPRLIGEVRYTSAIDCEFSYIEVDGNNVNAHNQLINPNGTATGITISVHHCFAHNCNSTSTAGGAHNAGINFVNSSTQTQYCFRNIVADIIRPSGSGNVYGIHSFTTGTHLSHNNTVYGIISVDGTGGGIRYRDDADTISKNNISVGNSVTGTGTMDDYTIGPTPSSTTFTNNVSEDSRGTITTGSGSDFNSPSTDQFWAASGSVPMVDAGADLVTTPTGVEIAFIASGGTRDVDSNGDTWDCGAFEFVAAAAGGYTGALLSMGVGD